VQEPPLRDFDHGDMDDSPEVHAFIMGHMIEAFT